MLIIFLFMNFQDLVKTHLTFAVREEVEVLRATIVELENRVSAHLLRLM